MKSTRTRRIVGDTLSHIFLAVMAVIWVVPIVWIFFEAFNANTLPFSKTFFPTQYSLNNFTVLFTQTDVINFPKMFLTTLVIAIFVCIISVLFVLAVAFCMSRLRFAFRRVFMNVALILGMFPGIMAVIAIYFILKAFGLTSSNTGLLIALILVYAAGSGAGFYVMKGYMDTIPMSLDEAAYLDGCTRWQVFIKIIIPICKPMIVYQAITSFLAPWLDFVMAKTVTRSGNFTVALGMWNMLQPEYINTWYSRFAAAAVCVSIPIAILFIVMQRFYTESMAGSVKG